MPPNERPVIYSIGHSRHPMETFLTLLRKHRIDLVADVRGQPWSRHNPQYNRERLEASLKAGAIAYSWRGEYLSGRPKGWAFHGPAGEVLWEKLRRWPALNRALDALINDTETRRIAMMCAEEDPNRCHRRFLLTPLLLARGASVEHIRGDGRLENEEALQGGEGPNQISLFP